MDASPTPLAKKEISLRGSIAVSLVQQAVLLMLGLAILDGGGVFQVLAYAAAAYWVGFAVILVRRYSKLTWMDKVLIRWGYLILAFIISPFVTRVMWNIRGY
jgi:hypothetical protein